jgi:hypothetical protein
LRWSFGLGATAAKNRLSFSAANNDQQGKSPGREVSTSAKNLISKVDRAHT